MSIQVNDFQWEPGKNDAEYIKLLKSSRDEWQKIAQKAITKLKTLSRAQEPRVMTLEEALAADYVYLEIKLHSSLTCECCILAIDPDGGILPLHKGFCAYLDGEDYGIDWRCWTSRPTDEQRKAVPWEAKAENAGS